MDPLVKNLTLTTTVTFGPGGTVERTRRYTFYIGNNGPFTLDYPPGKDTASQVQQDVQTEVQHLRFIGAIPAAGY